MKIEEIIENYDPEELDVIEYDEDLGEWIAEYGGDVIKLGDADDEADALKTFKKIMAKALTYKA